MQVGESTALIDLFEAKIAEDECSVKKEKYVKQNWKARINGHGTWKPCTGTRLYRKLKFKYDDEAKPRMKKPEIEDVCDGFLAGKEPYIKKVRTTKFEDISETRFNIQAHHLIPKNFLPDQDICAFLAENYDGDKPCELHEDAPYSCDHAHNGYCLPYATPLDVWKKYRDDDDKKFKICCDVMTITKRQLHQGSHRANPYEDPDEPDEEDNIHEDVPGYGNFITDLLTVVFLEAATHPANCEKCKEAYEDNKIAPRIETVKHMDQVSGIIKLAIDANWIYVSVPASLHLKKDRKPIEVPGWLE